MTNFDPNSLSIFATYEPERNPLLMFKASSMERLRAMQNGLLYMNSLSYFAEVENEPSGSLRGDPLEPVIGRVYGGKDGEKYYQFTLRYKKGDDEKVLDITEDAVLTVEIPKPSNVMIFCLSAIAFDPNWMMPGQFNHMLDRRLLEFGSHALIIKNPGAFADRLNRAIKSNPYIYSSKYFQGGYGLVEYIDLEGASTYIGVFRKDSRYSWQREFRLCFGVESKGLNDKGAFELEIGDISDITSLVSLESLLGGPININSRIVKKVGNEYVEVTPEEIASLTPEEIASRLNLKH